MKALTDDLKLKIYPTVVGILGLCLAASLFSHFEVQIFTEPAPSTDRSDSTAADLEAGRSPHQSTGLDSTSLKNPVASSPVPSSPAIVPSPAASPTAASIASGTAQTGTVGSLRVSNLTVYPVRVALLPIASGDAPAASPSKQAASGSNQPKAIEPVHWDFAPNEGSAKGLKLSLPDGQLQLQRGDVVVAFAEDGSRRYWGPFVVGKTALPLWNAAAQEWQLRLQP